NSHTPCLVLFSFKQKPAYDSETGREFRRVLLRSKVEQATTRMYRTAQSLTGYRLMPTQSISSAAGCSREYFLYKRKIPCITLEVGRGACPLSSSEFPSIWRKNKDVVIREAMLFD